MSRSHPGKRKPRQTRATAQIVCEGFTEEAFCRHLKSLYARGCGVHVDVHNARGGSPQDIIKAALVRRGYDRTFVFFDTDRPLPATWKCKSLAAGHVHVPSSPCIEAFLLHLLGKPCHGDTGACKRAFQDIFPGNTSCDFRAHARIFPKSLLDASSHPLLHKLLSAFKPPA